MSSDEDKHFLLKITDDSLTNETNENNPLLEFKIPFSDKRKFSRRINKYKSLIEKLTKQVAENKSKSYYQS